MPNKALIQLSIRYRYADAFWFSFFHEAAHILIHGRKEIFVDVDNQVVSEKEMEADKWASDFLIPPILLNDFINKMDISPNSIDKFAKKINVAPYIIIGRLCHEQYLDFSEVSDYRPKLEWEK